VISVQKILKQNNSFEAISQKEVETSAAIAEVVLTKCIHVNVVQSSACPSDIFFNIIKSRLNKKDETRFQNHL